MTQNLNQTNPGTLLRKALLDADASTRLQVAMSAGIAPDSAFIEPLIERCAVEPDFYVRDMLSWALLQQQRDLTLAMLKPELGAQTDQARSQALHTLSKIADPTTWEWITPAMLADPNDEVAKTAWRAAAAVVPEQSKAPLAEALVTHLGRGDRHLRLSLSRAIVSLGEVALPALAPARSSSKQAVKEHAEATARLIADPELGFDAAVAEARRIVALSGEPVARA